MAAVILEINTYTFFYYYYHIGTLQLYIYTIGILCILKHALRRRNNHWLYKIHILYPYMECGAHVFLFVYTKALFVATVCYVVVLLNSQPCKINQPNK